MQLLPGQVPQPNPIPVAGPVAPTPSATASDKYDQHTLSAGPCDEALGARGTDLYQIRAGIRAAVGAQLDPHSKHLEPGVANLICSSTQQPGQLVAQSILTWTDGSRTGLIIVDLAKFDSPHMSGCGFDQSCTPAPTRAGIERAQFTRNIPRIDDNPSFGVVVARRDGEYISIEAESAENTDSVGDPIDGIKHFPFDADDLLKVAADARITLDPETPKQH